MNNTKFKIYLRPDTKKKDGTSSIILFATVNGKRKYYSLHYSILPTFWNDKQCCVNSTCDNWHIINNTIENYLTKAKQLRQLADIEGRILKISELDEALRDQEQKLWSLDKILIFAEK
jgi:hypothetical protein